MRALTLGGWLERWLNLYKRPKLRPESLVPLEVCIRLHLPLKLLGRKLKRLHPLDLQEAVNAVPIGRTRKYTYDVLNESLRKAYALGLLRQDVMQKVEPPQHMQKQGQALTKTEQADLFDKLQGHALRSLILFYLYTGCRRNEALTLTFADLDTERGTLAIHGTKTKSSDRVLPLFPEVSAIIEAQPHTGARVFPYSPDYVTHAFKRLCPNHKLHDLRHTFATRCLESGISIRVVQQWLGHSKLDTTANRYTHILDDYQRQEAAKFHL